MDKKNLIFLIVLMVMQGLVDRGVDQSAHMGGLVSGFVLGIVLYHPKAVLRHAEESG